MKAIQKPPGLRRATEIVARPVRMLIYGEPGAGWSRRDRHTKRILIWRAKVGFGMGERASGV